MPLRKKIHTQMMTGVLSNMTTSQAHSELVQQVERLQHEPMGDNDYTHINNRERMGQQLWEIENRLDQQVMINKTSNKLW